MIQRSRPRPGGRPEGKTDPRALDQRRLRRVQIGEHEIEVEGEQAGISARRGRI